MGPFEFTKTINDTKHNLMDEDPEVEKDYIPFLVNRSLGYFMDTIMYANEMNRFNSLDYKLQYDFLLNIIRPRKRYSKWLKKSKNDNIFSYLRMSINGYISKFINKTKLIYYF